MAEFAGKFGGKFFHIGTCLKDFRLGENIHKLQSPKSCFKYGHVSIKIWVWWGLGLSTVIGLWKPVIVITLGRYAWHEVIRIDRCLYQIVNIYIYLYIFIMRYYAQVIRSYSGPNWQNPFSAPRCCASAWIEMWSHRARAAKHPSSFLDFTALVHFHEINLTRKNRATSKTLYKFWGEKNMDHWFTRQTSPTCCFWRAMLFIDWRVNLHSPNPSFQGGQFQFKNRFLQPKSILQKLQTPPKFSHFEKSLPWFDLRLVHS